MRYLAYLAILLLSLAIQTALAHLSVPWTQVVPVTILLGILAYRILRYEPRPMTMEEEE